MLKRDSRCVRHWLNQTRYGVFRASLPTLYSLRSTVSTNRGPCVAASAVSEPQTLSVGDGGRTVPDSPPTPPRFAPLNHLAFHRRTFKHCKCQCAHHEMLQDSTTLVRVVSVFRTLSVLEPVCPPVRGLRLHHWPATTSSARKCNAEDLPTLCCR